MVRAQWKQDARDVGFGLALALALSAFLIWLDVQASETGTRNAGSFAWQALMAAAGLGVIALWRRGRPRGLVVGTVAFAGLAPLLVETPWLWLLTAAAAVAWLAAPVTPALRLSGILLFWPLAAVGTYSVELGEANLWLAALAVGGSCLRLWWILPQEGPWRIVPYWLLLVPLVGASGLGVMLSFIGPSWQRALLAVGSAALAVGVWHLRHHPAWRPEMFSASASQEAFAPVP